MNATEDNIRKAELGLSLVKNRQLLFSSVRVPYGPVYNRIGGFYRTGIENHIKGVTKIQNMERYHTFTDSRGQSHVCYGYEEAKSILKDIFQKHLPQGINFEDCLRTSHDDNGNEYAYIFYRLTA